VRYQFVVLSYPAPLLSQYDDVKLLLEVSAVIFPGALQQHPGENGLRVWVDGTAEDHPEAGVRALATFQVVLGVLRTWDEEAGRLANEERRGLAPGSVRDEAGTQYVFLPSILCYRSTESAMTLARAAAAGVASSRLLQNALWLFGRENRACADFYMVHEFAEKELGGTKGIASTLDISVKSQKRFTGSVNNMSALQGGRHAVGENGAVTMDFAEQCGFARDLLKTWISLYGE